MFWEGKEKMIIEEEIIIIYERKVNVIVLVVFVEERDYKKE